MKALIVFRLFNAVPAQHWLNAIAKRTLTVISMKLRLLFYTLAAIVLVPIAIKGSIFLRLGM
ncbi:hypothetical protein ACE1CD_01855 [Aerosakkonema sp. BLCC-F183]|uniref:hypothetical protein n=1 Tax=Aerosakkonema sp. BLCC-F183 TaxID=3342834 RepID=UPI0035B99B7B